MQNVRFLSSSFFVPQNKITNTEIAEHVNTTDTWIREHTGIVTRHIAKRDQAASDLGYHATLRTLEGCELGKDDIRMIIVATSTPDYQGFPATASVLQEKLQIENCFSYDVTAACSGFVFACSAAIDAIQTGNIDTALIVGSEIFSSIVNWKDRNTSILFGDGAGACVLSSRFVGSSKIIARHFMTRPKEYRSLIRKHGGSATRDILTEDHDKFVSMEGRKVYQIVLEMFVECIESVIKKGNFKIEDIDYVVPHQANLKMLQNAAKKAGVPMEKFIINIDKYANTSAASIPIALTEAIKDNRIQRGSKILLMGFGAGLSCGGILLEW